MSGEAAAFVRSWRVGPYTAKLTVPQIVAGKPAAACVEWSPSEPTRLDAQQWREYRAGRNAVLAELAQQLGGSVAVIDL